MNILAEIIVFSVFVLSVKMWRTSQLWCLITKSTRARFFISFLILQKSFPSSHSFWIINYWTDNTNMWSMLSWLRGKASTLFLYEKKRVSHCIFSSILEHNSVSRTGESTCFCFSPELNSAHLNKTFQLQLPSQLQDNFLWVLLVLCSPSPPKKEHATVNLTKLNRLTKGRWSLQLWN